MAIVYRPVQNRVRDGGFADCLVPVIHWIMRGGERGTLLVTIVKNLKRHAPDGIRERCAGELGRRVVSLTVQADPPHQGLGLRGVGIEPEGDFTAFHSGYTRTYKTIQLPALSLTDVSEFPVPPLAEVCTKLGISETTLYSWKSSYAGMSTAQIARLDHLVQLCALQAQRIGTLETDVRVLEDALEMQALSPGEKGRLIRIFQSRYGVGLSRLCRLMSISRSFYAYQSMREPEG
jgi:hypothetical protein